ncbi:MAG: leucine-rich repeat domain-containing protein [Clostridia bacterium]|nr:leucine-rich repeat domain-containing protein [Clostridia bacterium]
MKKFVLLTLLLLIFMSLTACDILGTSVSNPTETTVPDDEMIAPKDEETTLSMLPKDEPTQGSVGLVYELNANGAGYIVTGIGTCTDTKIVIPAMYEGLPVTSIGPRAFSHCKKLTTIIIPDTVTKIGVRAFEWCSKLQTVEMGNGVIDIDANAFEECSFVSIKIGANVASIGNLAFAYCFNLKSIEIPPSVTKIGALAFMNTDLNAVYITDIAAWSNIKFDSRDSNPLYVASNLFLNGNLVTNLTFPDNMTIINDYTFYNCESIESIEISDRATLPSLHPQNNYCTL